MHQRALGTQGLNVAEIGYGAMGTAVGYGPSDDTESIAAIRTAYDAGVTMFDTAEMYGWGDGERLLGRAVAPFREEITIATKFGLTPDAGPDSRPEHIREVVDNSLRHLGVDHIDLLYQHAPDPAVPIEDVVGAMSEAVDAGKVKYLGLSNTGDASIRQAHATHPISVLQSEYSLFAREAEVLFPVLEELEIGFVAYSPLARGFLTGAVQPRSELEADDFRQNIPWWEPGNFEANVRAVDKLSEIAEAKNASVAQLALAWALAKKADLVPIPGSRNPERVADNTASAGLSLTESDVNHIEEIVSANTQG